MTEFRKLIEVRNILLNAAEKYYKAWNEGDPRYKSDEYLTFDPNCGEDKKIIHVKVFFGTRDKGVLKGYHTLDKKSYKKFIKNHKNEDINRKS